MSNIVLVIGNGFDLDLGLKSSYCDFVGSDEWEELVSFAEKSFFDSYINYSLIFHLRKESEKSNWFDIEESIRSYIKKHYCCPDSINGLIHSEFDLVRRCLRAYLKRVTQNFVVDESKVSYKLLKLLQECNIPVYITSFNYTNCFNLCKLSDCESSITYFHIHNSIEDDNIILGCRLMPFDFSKKEFSFFFKSNMIQKANHLYLNLIKAQEVIFFGHSLNLMDFCYFDDYFKWIASQKGESKYITFITKDVKSELIIRENLGQDYNIKLYSHLKSVDYIHTDSLYCGSKKDDVKWNSLINRINNDMQKYGKIKKKYE